MCGEREDVSGTSTVVARDDNARGGLQCITVADVIRAVDGPLVSVYGVRPEAVSYNANAEVLQHVWTLGEATVADYAARIAENKKAAFNYFFEERFEAGIVLEGWEVKALRAGKVQLTDGYVVIRNGEMYLIGLQINPLNTASSHVNPDSVRTKKLLLHNWGPTTGS